MVGEAAAGQGKPRSASRAERRKDDSCFSAAPRLEEQRLTRGLGRIETRARHGCDQRDSWKNMGCNAPPSGSWSHKGLPEVRCVRVGAYRDRRHP